jgi:hypothetical protein
MHALNVHSPGGPPQPARAAQLNAPPPRARSASLEGPYTHINLAPAHAPEHLML